MTTFLQNSDTAISKITKTSKAFPSADEMHLTDYLKSLASLCINNAVGVPAILKIYNFLIAQEGRKHGALVRMEHMENTTQSSAIPSYEVALLSYMAIVSIALNLFILLSNTIVLITFGKYKKLKVQHYYMVALVGTDLTILLQNTTPSGKSHQTGNQTNNSSL